MDITESVNTDSRISDFEISDSRLTTLQYQTKALLYDLKFRNGMKLAAGNNNSMHKRCIKLNGRLNELILLIDEELEE